MYYSLKSWPLYTFIVAYVMFFYDDHKGPHWFYCPCWDCTTSWCPSGRKLALLGRSPIRSSLPSSLLFRYNTWACKRIICKWIKSTCELYLHKYLDPDRLKWIQSIKICFFRVLEDMPIWCKLQTIIEVILSKDHNACFEIN